MSVRRAIEVAALGVAGTVGVAMAVWAPERLPRVVATVVVMFVVTEAALAWWLPGPDAPDDDHRPGADDAPDGARDEE